jgi:hypothetical protein
MPTFKLLGLPCIYGDLFDPSSLRSNVFGYPDVFVITSDDVSGNIICVLQ